MGVSKSVRFTFRPKGRRAPLTAESLRKGLTHDPWYIESGRLGANFLKGSTMEECLRYCDEFGPSRIVHIYEPSIGLKAVLSIDNLACGPALGGVRFAVDGSTEEAFRLSRAMTFKNAAAGLPHGGGKAIIFADPKLPDKKKEPLIRAFALAIKNISEYIPGPDMGMNELLMAWIYDEIGRGIGRPQEVGGIPLDKMGATGFGIAISASVASEYAGFPLEGAKIAIQGFGAVGKNAALFLNKRGSIIVAASDSSGTVFAPEGLNVESLITHKESGKQFSDFPGVKKLPPDKIIDIESDVWIPAARPDVITTENASRLKTRIFLPGANIPVTAKAAAMLMERGVIVLPDFITNAGGVICGAMEYRGMAQSMVFEVIEDKIGSNLREIFALSKEQKLTPVQAALKTAEERVKRAMKYSRWR